MAAAEKSKTVEGKFDQRIRVKHEPTSGEKFTVINLSIRSTYLISNARLKQQQRNEKLKYHFFILNDSALVSCYL